MINRLNNFKNSKPLFYDLLCGVLTALLFSSFIYLEHYGFTIKVLNTLFGLLSLAMFLYMPRRAVLAAGFFIGLLWFYWIGYSFKYNGVGWMMPIITFSFAIIYMLFFGVLALTEKVYIRAALLFGLSFFEPFDWNWLQIELLFVDSYIGVFKYQLIIVLLALSLPQYVKKSYKFLPLALLFLALNYHTPLQNDAPLKIKLVATDIKQEEKWLRESKSSIIRQNLDAIEQAIIQGYDLVLLPESTFPLYMNRFPRLHKKLELLSYEISIVTGALYKENGHNYNVTYFYENGKTQIAKKLVLVPFGEYIPLPKFAQKMISDFFFAGQADFVQAQEPTDFIIKGTKFRNAICYEATCQELYDGEVNYVLATSNNAWFKPSIEPTIQKLLLRYYGRKNGATVYHSANWSGTGVIK